MHTHICLYIYFYRKPLFFFLLKYSSIRVVKKNIIELFQALRKTINIEIILFWFPKVILQGLIHSVSKYSVTNYYVQGKVLDGCGDNSERYRQKSLPSWWCLVLHMPHD